MKFIPFFFISLLMLSCQKEMPEAADPEDFQTITFEQAGIEGQRIVDLEKAITAGKYNIHGMLILRDGRLVYEHYFQGEDAIFPEPAGVLAHSRETLHDCRSLTKSIVSACIGIAISQGRIKSVDENIFTYLPAYKKYAKGRKADLTIRDLLTMSSGLEWNEKVIYTDPANDERLMSTTPDVMDFVLGKNSIAMPGETWNYNGGCTQLLAGIIKNASGMSIDKFAQDYLFSPLGISDYNWFVRDPSTVWAPSGLRLKPMDMARIGQLYLQKGAWKGKQILSPAWVDESLKWQIDTDDSDEGYGFQFWCYRPVIAGVKRDVSMAIGNGGQRICMIPSMNIQIVLTAGNYDETGDISDDLLTQVIFPAITY